MELYIVKVKNTLGEYLTYGDSTGDASRRTLKVINDLNRGVKALEVDTDIESVVCFGVKAYHLMTAREGRGQVPYKIENKAC